MIYTVTFNPSIDYTVRVNPLLPGKTNRSSKELFLPGGKGINVSIVLKNLGIDSTALGFTAGFTGKQIEKLVADCGCKTDFINIDNGFSRINIKIKSDTETEINGSGPDISKCHIDRLFDKLSCLSADDMLVLAGSIPQSMPDSIYKDIMRSVNKDTPVVVDATRDLLVNVLEERPFLIKPNNHELSEIFGRDLNNLSDIISAAKDLQRQGARNVLVSMAGDGAALTAENGEVLFAPAPEGKVVNSVGAGDSMVAGFIAGYTEKRDYSHAFRLGISAGSASAFSEHLASKKEIYSIYEQLNFQNQKEV